MVLGLHGCRDELCFALFVLRSFCSFVAEGEAAPSARSSESLAFLRVTSVATDTSRCDVSEAWGETSSVQHRNPITQRCVLLHRYQHCTDKWEIAPDLSCRSRSIWGCTGSECCFSAFAAERVPALPCCCNKGRITARVCLHSPPLHLPLSPLPKRMILHGHAAAVKPKSQMFMGACPAQMALGQSILPAAQK